MIVYKDVYDILLPRSSAEQYEKSKKVKKESLQTGDLVFFKIEKGGKISHVGIYLGNNKFVHASTSKGVRIDDLETEYYRKTFLSGGRYGKRS
ncbi:MAG: C40 family peptidase [Bacteroidota bacterium]|nr:C40 family peptidase [Bacteroidota bacterium]